MKKMLKKLEDVFAAAAYAEAGEHETAKEMLGEKKRIEKRDRTSKKTRKQFRAPGANR